MTGEQVPAWLLEAGDVIRLCHHHDPQCGQCLARWQTDAVVTEAPAPVCGLVAVNWAGDARLPGGGSAVTGVSVFGLDEHVQRIGCLPGEHPA
jgi:hypothetical protein